MNLAPPVYQFLGAATGGAKMDSLTSMPYPGFKPGTFGAAAGFPNTARSANRMWERYLVPNWVVSFKKRREKGLFSRRETRKVSHKFKTRMRGTEKTIHSVVF